MPNIGTQDAAVSDRSKPELKPRRLLIGLDRWLANLSMTAAVSVLTAGAALLANGLARIAWIFVGGDMPYRVPLLASAIGSLIACPIILHSQKLIKALERKRRELTSLTVSLARARDEAEASNRSKITFLAI